MKLMDVRLRRGRTLSPKKSSSVQSLMTWWLISQVNGSGSVLRLSKARLTTTPGEAGMFTSSSSGMSSRLVKCEWPDHKGQLQRAKDVPLVFFFIGTISVLYCNWKNVDLESNSSTTSFPSMKSIHPSNNPLSDLKSEHLFFDTVYSLFPSCLASLLSSSLSPSIP